MRGDLFQQCLLDGQVLGDGFDNPIAIAKKRQVVFKISGDDPLRGGVFVEGGWFRFQKPFDSALCELTPRLALCACGNDIQKNYGQARICQMSGDA